jgi:hypothetical protein
MRGPNPAPGIAVKIFVKKNIILEVWIGGQFGMIF